jgi:hypothetical protein
MPIKNSLTAQWVSRGEIMINIRKLAAVDMAGLGTRVIVVEYALGILLPLILGVISIRSGLKGPAGWQAVSGFWLAVSHRRAVAVRGTNGVAIACNYIPLFIYAVLIAKAGTVQEEGQPEFVHLRRYSLQQVIILIPCGVVVLALNQEYNRRRKTD